MGLSISFLLDNYESVCHQKAENQDSNCWNINDRCMGIFIPIPMPISVLLSSYEPVINTPTTSLSMATTLTLLCRMSFWCGSFRDTNKKQLMNSRWQKKDTKAQIPCTIFNYIPNNVFTLHTSSNFISTGLW